MTITTIGDYLDRVFRATAAKEQASATLDVLRGPLPALLRRHAENSGTAPKVTLVGSDGTARGTVRLEGWQVDPTIVVTDPDKYAEHIVASGQNGTPDEPHAVATITLAAEDLATALEALAGIQTIRASTELTAAGAAYRKAVLGIAEIPSDTDPGQTIRIPVENVPDMVTGDVKTIPYPPGIELAASATRLVIAAAPAPRKALISTARLAAEEVVQEAKDALLQALPADRDQVSEPEPMTGPF